MTRRIGILTGGGDCPGLNAAIRAVVRRSLQHRIEVVAIYEGFKGLTENKMEPFPLQKASGILHVGGTILKTSRFNPFTSPKFLKQAKANFVRHGLEGLIVIGGEGSLRLANELHSTLDIPCIGIPKTIDNDVWGTDCTIGFDTAVATATEAIDKLHTTADSHNVVMILEVMGRHTGWIATYSGLAGGADMILTPEKSVTIESILKTIENRNRRNKNFSIIVVSEDARVVDKKGKILISTPMGKDHYGHVKVGGIGKKLGELIHSCCGVESRVVVLGHVQRGGSPTPRDRILATRFGVMAADLAKRKKWNRMTAVQKDKTLDVPLASVRHKIKQADMELYKIASYFFE